jgi:hypothetical protein
MSERDEGMNEFTAKYIEDGAFQINEPTGHAYLHIACQTEKEATKWWGLAWHPIRAGSIIPRHNFTEVRWMGRSVHTAIEKMNLGVDHPKIHQLLAFYIMNS